MSSSRSIWNQEADTPTALQSNITMSALKGGEINACAALRYWLGSKPMGREDEI